MIVSEDKIRLYNEKIDKIRELSNQIFSAENNLANLRDQQQDCITDAKRLMEDICTGLGMEEP